MTVLHDKIYSRFKSIVDARQTSRPELDIREFVSSIASSSITFGYISRNFSQGYPANLRKLFPASVGFDSEQAMSSEWAAIPRAPVDNEKLDPHVGTERILDNFEPDDNVLFFEQGFVASAASWSHSFREQKIEFACLAYMFDDLAFYYMSEYENRLTRKLNSTSKPDAHEFARADAVINKLVSEKISKYNSQPDYRAVIGEPGKRKVLVIDQSYGDSSTHYGLAEDSVFEEMLLAAIKENPDADVIVKTHPDSIYEKDTRAGYYSGLRDFENVYFFRQPINPFSLFEMVEKVYVATSGVGLEALLAGKPVVCFGAPFYSGWGLTDDRQSVPHRQRQRSLTELFHYTYIWYTHYFTPLSDGECQIEEALDYITRYRSMETRPDLPDSHNPVRVSVIVPAYNAQSFLGQTLDSLLEQTLVAIEIIVLNDGSSDGTLTLIQRYAAHDKRVRCVDLKENIGQGFARNQGIAMSLGDYVFFLDSDDYLLNSSVLESVYRKAAETEADMVRMRKAYEALEDGSGRFVGKRDDACEEFFNAPFSETRIEDSPFLFQNRHFWTFLYRREFLLDNEIEFSTPQWEERPFLTRSLLSAAKIADSHVPAIVYRVRRDSTARRVKKARDLQFQLQNYRETMEALSAAGVELKPAKAMVSTQIVHALFYGWYWETLQSLPASEKSDQLAKVQTLLSSSLFSPEEMSADAYNVSKIRFAGYEYQLLLALASSGLWHQVDRVLAGETFSAREMYELIKGPEVALAWSANHFSKYSQKRLTYDFNAGDAAIRPRIILHIGSTKTGSTYLQHFCDLNRAELLNRGIWFPEFGQFWQSSRPHKQAGHSEFIHAAHKRDYSLRDRILAGEAITGKKIESVVLSSEAFFLMQRPGVLLDYFSGFDVTVVAYLRQQEEWARSQYAEFVAGGAIGKVSDSFSDWIDQDITRSRLVYDKKLDSWARFVGRENVVVRRYSKEYLLGGDLVEDFFSSIGLEDAAGFERPPELQHNKAVISSRHLPLIRALNRFSYSSAETYFDFIDRVEAKLAHLDASDSRNEFLKSLPVDLEQAIDKGNAYIAEAYLKEATGPLYPAVIKERAQSDLVPLKVTSEEAEAILDAYTEATSKSSDVLSFEMPSHSLDDEPVFNLGYFSWRRQLKRLIRRYYRDRLSAEELLLFDSNVGRLQAETGSRVLRTLIPYFYSQGSVYGFLKWRALLTPYVSRLILKFWGAAKYDEYIESPVKFVRHHNKPVLVILGRILYPMGELRP
ncbi:glycosyltransferase [Halioglobus maricola]|uniref:Glycosyltransferase n=1 Tax=Halioglobus maricola TaxID=2601894 RepID=A0A5P9NFB5_9GAMM|nr:glycosyltransferase [Halioglobus maricola]QFU74471.1 glycosyltransferase [Halioglobus maricola]